MCPAFRISFALLASLLILPEAQYGFAAQTSKLIVKPGEPVLLLGSPTVQSTRNLQQRWFSAERHEANPVLRRSEPWEGVGPYLFGSRLMQDEKSGELRLWYIAYRFEDNSYPWGYATSTDGLHWKKPDLGLERFRNAPAKNCLSLGPHPEKGTRSIARDPRIGTPDARRHLGVRFTYDGEFVSFSSNGLAWTESPLNPVWHVPSDIIHVMWDLRRQKFIAFYKIWEVQGQEVRPGEKGTVAFDQFMPFFTPKELGSGTVELEGPCVTFRPPDVAKVESRKFVLKSGGQASDDGGGTSLSGEWSGKRVQAYAESDDGIHWRNEQVILRAEEQDSATANIQYLFVIQYGGYYVGFATLHDESGTFRLHLAWSEDGLKWNRASRVPWLDVGAAGAFDSGMVLGPGDPIFQQKEMWFLYGGFPITHDTKRTDWEAAIGLARMRLDGFAAWEAAKEQGELITQPFICNSDKLFVNATAQDGELVVEVLDDKQRPIKGYAANACAPIKTDTLEQTESGWLQWKTHRDLAPLKGKVIQLRFLLRNAKLYSFRIASAGNELLEAPRATKL
jgi:hypothetical protein